MSDFQNNNPFGTPENQIPTNQPIPGDDEPTVGYPMPDPAMFAPQAEASAPTTQDAYIPTEPYAPAAPQEPYAAPVPEEPFVNAYGGFEPPAPAKSFLSKKLIIIGAAALTAIILLIVALCVACSGSDEEPANLFNDDGLIVYGERNSNNEMEYGLVDEDGEIVLEAQYYSLELLGEGLAIAGEYDKDEYSTHYALITINGEELTGYDYGFMGSLSDDGLILVGTYDDGDSLYGFINEDGEEVIPVEFDDANSFSEGLAAACEDGEWGFIDTDGEWVIEPNFDDVSFFDNGMCKAVSGSRQGFIDEDGDWIFKARFSVDSYFYDGLCIAQEDGEWGYINEDGEWVIPPRFKVANQFSDEGLACVSENGNTYGFIDKDGEMVIPDVFERASSFSEGLACVREEGDDLYGYIDEDGDWVIEPSFKSAGSFNCGLACVKEKENDDYGFIDDSGEMVIPDDYTRATSFFDDGYAIVCIDDEVFVINEDGEPIWGEETVFDSVAGYSN